MRRMLLLRRSDWSRVVRTGGLMKVPGRGNARRNRSRQRGLDQSTSRLTRNRFYFTDISKVYAIAK
jgi:hypothetical protein